MLGVDETGFPNATTHPPSPVRIRNGHIEHPAVLRPFEGRHRPQLNVWAVRNLRVRVWPLGFLRGSPGGRPTFPPSFVWPSRVVAVRERQEDLVP